MLGNGPVRFGGRPHGKGPAQRAPRRAAHPVLRHGRSTSASLRLAGALMVVFAVWFGLSAGYTQVEAFHDGLDRPVCPIRGAHPPTTPATCPVPTHPTSPVASVAVGHGSS